MTANECTDIFLNIVGVGWGFISKKEVCYLFVSLLFEGELSVSLIIITFFFMEGGRECYLSHVLILCNSKRTSTCP